MVHLSSDVASAPEHCSISMLGSPVTGTSTRGSRGAASPVRDADRVMLATAGEADGHNGRAARALAVANPTIDTPRHDAGLVVVVAVSLPLAAGARPARVARR